MRWGGDAVAFIRAMGLEQVDLLRVLPGGGVAQMVALQAPDLVRRMILAGTGPRGGGGIDEITKIAVVAYAQGCDHPEGPQDVLVLPSDARRETSGEGVPGRAEGAHGRSGQADLDAGQAGAAQGHSSRRAP